MSVLFPKVNKMPKWEWRPIYYDPKKDEMDRKLKALQAKRAAEENAAADSKSDNANYTPSLHRGSFRESHTESAMNVREKANRQSRFIIWIAVLCLLIFTFYVLF